MKVKVDLTEAARTLIIPSAWICTALFLFLPIGSTPFYAALGGAIGLFWLSGKIPT